MILKHSSGVRIQLTWYLVRVWLMTWVYQLFHPREAKLMRETVYVPKCREGEKT